LEGGRGGDIQDRAAVPFEHAGQQQGGQLCERRHVDLDHFELALNAELRDGTMGAEAGVVHQDVYVNVLLCQRLRDLAGTAWLAQVSGQSLRGGAVLRGEFVRQLTQLVLAASDQYQLRAVAGVKPGQFPPDPGRSAGNQHRSARRCRGGPGAVAPAGAVLMPVSVMPHLP
jgi:hypothetical protein